jgi:transposase-like protein
MQAALEQLPGSVIRDGVLAQWEAGRCQPKEAVILEEVMAALERGEPGPQERARECLSGLGITPRDEALEDGVQATQGEAAKALLTPDLPVSSVAEHSRQMVFAMHLSYWNVPLSRIGLWLGKGKRTLSGWVVGLAMALWPVIQGGVVSQVQASHLYLDEKWLTIRGRWHYWFVALDDATGFPVLAHLFPTRTTWACRWFLVPLKRLGKAPQPIITDGLAGYASGIAKVFAGAKHLLCLFPHQHGVTRWVKTHMAREAPEATRVKKSMKRVGQTQDSRTVRRRLARLEAEDARHGWGLASWMTTTRKNRGRLIPALREHQYPKTTNPIERFFRTFQRFDKTRGGFHAVRSAQQALLLFLVVYLFTQQAETGKAPIEHIVPAAARMPLYRLLNDPFAYGMATMPHKNRELEEMATAPFEAAASGQ